MQSSLRDRPPASPPHPRDEVLSRIQDRVLWLAMQIVHHANNVRPNPDRMKVGGHQTSSASVATILTSLFFEYMRPEDRIAIKPHASPVYHAIQYLLGNLDREYLTRLRDFHGLQAYPSRTKDPDFVDFSTGSVGLGAIAPNFAALSQEYLAGRDLSPSRFGAHRDDPPPSASSGRRLRREGGEERGRSRFISLAGDAELDEGTVWEAVVEPQLAETPNVLWVVDLNRQSLDRIIPGIRVRMWRQMFAANGWRVIDAKYGAQLEAAFALPSGELLRECIDDMPNETYQRLLRHPPEALREWLPRYSQHPADLAKLISQWDDAELRSLYANLGGHDFTTLRRAFAEADEAEQPCVVFAYTMKGWRLPSQGDPQNHSVLMSQRQMDQLQKELGIDDVWGGLDAETAEGRLSHERGSAIREARRRVQGEGPSLGALRQSSGQALGTASRLRTQQGTTEAVLAELGRPYSGQMSTQQAFGIMLVDIARELPRVAERIVTASPDVASSTNLGGWINKVGVWSRAPKGTIPEDREQRALQWRESQAGQHIELGISEANLFMLLGQLGLTKEMSGEVLYPIGTLYDPFVLRALEALLYNLYSGSRFIVVGTPSGITLSREGGAHQSFLTPSVGLGLPDTAYYEPCFAQEMEWVLLDAIEQVRTRKRSAYLRLSTKRVDQDAASWPEEPEAREHLRRQVLGGGYRLVDRSGEGGYIPGENAVHILAAGSIVPEALAASTALLEQGVFANVVNVTSPGMLFQAYERWKEDRLATERRGPPALAGLIPEEERGAPIVTVVDGHPSALAWVGSAVGSTVLPLGVSGFGQSGSLGDLYREYGIDAESITKAALVALEG